MKIKKLIKYSLSFFAVTILIVVILLGGFIYHTSYSESGGQLVFEQTQGFLKDFFNIELSASEYSIKPLQFWQIKDLRVVKQEEENGGLSLDILVKSVDLKMSFSILSQNLLVPNFEIDGANIKAKLKAPESTEPEIYDGTESEETDLNTMIMELFLVSSEVIVEKFSVKNSSLDFHYITADQDIRVRESINLEGMFRFKDRRMAFQLNSNLKNTGEPSMTLDSEFMNLSFDLESQIDFDFEVGLEESSWVFRSKDSKSNLEVVDFEMIQKSKGETARLDAEPISLEFKLNQEIRTNDIRNFPFLIAKNYGLFLTGKTKKVRYRSKSLKGKVLSTVADLEGILIDIEVPDRPGAKDKIDSKLSSLIRVEKIRSPFLKKPAILLFESELSIKDSLESGKFNLIGVFDGIRFLNTENTLDVNSQNALSSSLKVEFPRKVLNKFVLPALPFDFSGLRGRTVLEIKKKAEVQHILDFISSLHSQLDYSVQVSIDNPSEKPFSSLLVNSTGTLQEFKPTQLKFDLESPSISYMQNSADQIKLAGSLDSSNEVRLKLNSKTLKIDGLKSIESLVLEKKANISSDYNEFKGELSVSAFENSVVSIDFAARVLDSCDIQINTKLIDLEVASKLLKQNLSFLGQWKADLTSKFSSQKSCLDVSSSGRLLEEEKFNVHMSGVAQQTEDGEGQFSSVFYDDVKFDFNMNMADELEVMAKLDLPQIDVKKLLKSGEMKMEFDSTLNRKTLKSGKLNFEMENKTLSLAKPDGGFESFGAIKSKVVGELNADSVLTLPIAYIDFGDRFFRTRVSGQYDLKRKNSLIQGRVQLQSKSKEIKTVLGSVLGKMTIPFELGIRRGTELKLTGRMLFNKFFIEKDGFAIGPINGPVNFEERLSLKGKAVSFTEVIQRNPFERVEYKQVQPLLSEADQLFVKEVRWAGRSFGPIYGFFSVKQNLLNMHSFDFVFPDGGHMDGEFSLDFRPQQLEIGLLNRVTQLRLSKVLPEKFLKGIDRSKDMVSARTGIVFNLNEGQINGRIDVTKVSEDGLLSLLNVLDPTYENDQINKARLGLSLAAPSEVVMVFNQGFVDVEISFDALAVPGISLYGIPVSQIMLSKLEGIKKLLQEIPLK